MSDRTCSVEGCDRSSATAGYCKMHYLRVWSSGAPGPVGPLKRGPKIKPVSERFWPKVVKTPTCWLWTGATMKNGYGYLMLDRAAKKRVLAHRWAFEQAYGPIPDGMDIDHRCHRRECVNPEHLQAVSRSLNNENRGRLNRNSSTGVRGVSFDRARGQFVAYATHNNRKYHGGRFGTLEQAEAAAIALRNQLMTNNLLDRS